jgi:hypothetical protein
VETDRVARISAWVARVASVFFALAAAWEIGAPLEGGHWASMSACAIAGENMLRYRLFAAVTHYPIAPPPSHTEYYCRHPYAIYAMEALGRLLFGHHPWVVRLPAVLCSAATPVVLHRLGRELWGPVPAAVATVGFVVVPIDLAFACFSSLEVPTILFGLVFCLGTTRVWQSGRWRDAAIAAAGALGACHSDWIGALLVGSIATLAIARGHVGPRSWRVGVDPRGERRWLALAISAAAGTIALYTLLVVHAGQLDDVLYGASLRSAGHQGTLHAFFNRYRMMRLGWMIPGAGFAVLAVALPVAVRRARARPGEIVLLGWTVMATFQYVVFRQGADVHVFWPHYFGPCVALALGTLASALLPLRVDVRARRVQLVALATLVGVPLLLLARVAGPVLDQSRLTQGRFDEHELFIESGAAAAEFAAWATRGAPASALVRCTRLCGKNVEYATGLAQMEAPGDGKLDLSPRATADRDRLMLVDARYTPADQLRTLARTFDVHAAGPLLRVDAAVAGDGIRAATYTERQPAGLERLLVTDHDLVRAIDARPDPWATWAWADALGTPLPPAPDGEPSGLEQLSVAYGLARLSGDDARATALRARAIATLDDARETAFTDDVRLLGTSVERGPATVVTLLWEAGPAFEPPPESSFVVRCRIVEPPPLWAAPVDPLEKEMAPPMTIKPALWRAGRLYVQRFPLLHRPGQELCRGYFVPSRPRPLRGRFDVELFTLE